MVKRQERIKEQARARSDLNQSQNNSILQIVTLELIIY